MQQQGKAPGTKVRRPVITAIIEGRARHRILGLLLRHGQTLESLDGETREKTERIAARYGLDTATLPEWWWYAEASDQEPVPDHRLKRGDVIIVEGERGGGQFFSLIDPLEFYLRRMQLTPIQTRAGQKLYQLWRHGNILSRYRVMKYDDVRGTGSDPHALALLSREYLNAMESISDHRAREVAFSVCCEGKLIAMLGGFTSRRSAQRYGMRLLRQALDDLVRHFKLRHKPD